MADANIYSSGLTLGDRVKALSGFDASSSRNAFDTTTFSSLTTQWLKEGIMEVLKLLPEDMLERAKTYFTFESNPVGAEIESPECDVSNVTMHNGSKMIQCRFIHPTQKGKLEDSSDILYATSTDPAYYLEGGKINVLPYGYECRYASYNLTKDNLDKDELLNVLESDNEINDFPYEAQELVVLSASIKALEYLSATEEDPELYNSLIGNLKQDYVLKVNVIKNKSLVQPSQGKAS